MRARIEGPGARVTGWGTASRRPCPTAAPVGAAGQSGSGHALRLDTVADLHPCDLESAGKEDGRYGFAVAVPGSGGGTLGGGGGTRLELAILPHNTPALALYRKLGPVAHPVTGETRRHMALPLLP